MQFYLVQPSCEIDDNFSSSVIVNDLKLTNVTCSDLKKKKNMVSDKPYGVSKEPSSLM